MRCEIIKIDGDWQDVKDCAMTTIGKLTGKEPDSEWKRRILLSEHSPIREIQIKVRWINIPYWVAMHFRTHHVGVQWYIESQRDDRSQTTNQTHIARGKKPQEEPVNMRAMLNIQAVINISKKRLCRNASAETSKAWEMFLEELSRLEPEITDVCVPECVYRGKCFDFYSCGFDKTKDFIMERSSYEGVEI